MSVLPTDRPPAPPRDEEALIREAKRRQRRRQFAVGAAIAVLAGLIAAATSLDGPAPRHHHHVAAPSPKPVQTRTPRPPIPDTIPHDVGTTLLLWPVGNPTFGPGGGPNSYADNLATGRTTQTARPAVSAGDYQPLLVRTGKWIVYVGNGTTAIRASLKGRPRVLSPTPFFVPAAQPGDVWLWFKSTFRLASVTGGPLGPPVTLPRGWQPIAGTDAGLLLDNASGTLELWQPGSSPRPLPGSAYAGLTDGFGVSARLIAYGSGCTSVGISAASPYEPNGGYYTCRLLRVLDVITGRMSSFPAPHGTRGWLPYGFDVIDPVSPGNTLIAAGAAIPSQYNDKARLYLISPARPDARPRLVPESTAFVRMRVAWSVRGGWLFYEVPPVI